MMSSFGKVSEVTTPEICIPCLNPRSMGDPAEPRGAAGHASFWVNKRVPTISPSYPKNEVLQAETEGERGELEGGGCLRCKLQRRLETMNTHGCHGSRTSFAPTFGCHPRAACQSTRRTPRAGLAAGLWISVARSAAKTYKSSTFWGNLFRSSSWSFLECKLCRALCRPRET
jgi:hypothetical protein